MADYRDDYGQEYRRDRRYDNDRSSYRDDANHASYRGGAGRGGHRGGGYGGGYHDDNDRGAMDRAGDEVKSWFGDDDAERRRRMDERRDYETGRYGGYNDRGGSRDRGYYGSSERGGDRDGDRWGGYAGGRGQYEGQYEGQDRYGSARRSSFRGDELYDRGAGDSHYGKGPKNDVRSKERLQERISDEMHDDHDLDASNIEVTTQDNGEVTLEGSVASRWEKRRAENCAYDVRGVRHVQNNIRIAERSDSTDESRSVARDPDATNRPTTGRKTATKT